MSFFDFATEGDEGSGRWALSGEFWLYWVVVLPLTALTLTLWYAWQRDRARREERSQVGNVDVQQVGAPVPNPWRRASTAALHFYILVGVTTSTKHSATFSLDSPD